MTQRTNALITDIKREGFGNEEIERMFDGISGDAAGKRL